MSELVVQNQQRRPATALDDQQVGVAHTQRFFTPFLCVVRHFGLSPSK
jgi:hypothetical protein